jgi:VanZ like family/Concanavalin A-like lectin/glucanases superfamily
MTQTRAGILLGASCLLIWLVLLGFGLWPFDFLPRNQVEWLRERNGIHFAGYGEVYGPTIGNLNGGSSTAHGTDSYSIEIWLDVWSKTYPEVTAIFVVDNPATPPNLAIMRSGPDLLVRGRFLDKENGVVTRKLWMDDACLKGEPRFITFTSGPEDSALYLEGVLQKRYPLVLTNDSLVGRLLLGHSPTGKEAWTGDVFALAIYNRALTAEEVSRHYEDWQQARIADLANERGIVALYPFNEGSGTVIHNRAGSAPDLILPNHFKLLHANTLSPGLDIHRSNLRDIVVNIVGFAPFGFFGCAYLRCVRRLGKVQSALTIIALGAITSLAIEFLQAHLPSRDSSLLDVIDNTLGTVLGMILFMCVSALGFETKLIAD